MDVKRELVHVTKILMEAITQIDQVRLETVELSYLIGQITSKLVEGQTVLRRTKKMWSRGKFDDSLFHLLGIKVTCGGEPCFLELAIPGMCQLSSNNTELSFFMTIPKVQNKLTAFKADPFVTLTGIGNESQVCTLRYGGPQVVIKKAGCQVPLVDLENQPEKYYLIPRWNCDNKTHLKMLTAEHFTMGECFEKPEVKWEKWTQVKMTEINYWIYCPGRTISHYNLKRQECPSSPFSISLADGFWIDSEEYLGGFSEIEAADDFSVELGWHPKRKETVTMLTDLKGIGDTLAEMKRPQDVDLSHLTAEANALGNHMALWLKILITVGSTVLIMLVLLFACRYFRMKKKQHQPVHSGRVKYDPAVAGPGSVTINLVKNEERKAPDEVRRAPVEERKARDNVRRDAVEDTRDREEEQQLKNEVKDSPPLVRPERFSAVRTSLRRMSNVFKVDVPKMMPRFEDI